MPRRALLSCYHKDGLEDLAAGLCALGWKIHASGGTADYLSTRGVEVSPTEEITGIVSLLGGRVKTLHPALYTAILAAGGDRSSIEGSGGLLIDLVCVDFYPFGETAGMEPCDPSLVELIDIGGPSLVRAAAKNWRHVIAAAGSDCFGEILETVREGRDDDDFRRRMAARVFDTVSAYDLGISLSLERGLVPALRYGENPHQAAQVHFTSPRRGFASAGLVHGDSLSYNNYLDAEAAWDLAVDLGTLGPSVVLLKHGNPCGAGVGADLPEAFRNAFRADGTSPYGGILAASTPVGMDFLAEIRGLFLELLLAPGFGEGVVETLSKRKKMRVLEMPVSREHRRTIRSIWGGLLVQEPDSGTAGELPGRTVTRRMPTAAEMSALDVAWRICRCVRSNAIVLADRNGAIGVGAGQMNRVESLELAVRRAGRAGLPTAGSVMASDGYLPFRDCIDMAAAAGVTAVVQPGGSMRDEESVAAADEHGLAMIFTGRRHFRH